MGQHTHPRLALYESVFISTVNSITNGTCYHEKGLLRCGPSSFNLQPHRERGYFFVSRHREVNPYDAFLSFGRKAVECFRCIRSRMCMRMYCVELTEREEKREAGYTA